ncbi:MAG: hypothetical protein ABH830_00560 [Patescibacteria group bacterium]
MGIYHEKKFRKGKKNFQITVNYGSPLHEEWSKVLRMIVWRGNIELKGRTFNLASSTKDFTCYLATLKEESHLWKIEKDFQNEEIIPADMMQFFAFCQQGGLEEINPDCPLPIVAAAPGSTWRCSHETLHEMAGVYWDGFYHNPGPNLSTVSAPFEIGTRFLAIRPPA